MINEEIDNPTEWGAMIGTALMDPARREEFERKSSLKLAVTHKISCDCGILLDQQTAVCLVATPDRVRVVACPACMMTEIRKSITTVVDRYGADFARKTLTTDFALWTWNDVKSGEDLWSYSAATATATATAPRKPRSPKTGRLTPAEIRHRVYGWTDGAEIVLSGTFCMRTIPGHAKMIGKQKPAEKHASPETLARLARQFEEWCGQGYGAELTGAPETIQDGHTIACTVFRDSQHSEVCRIDTRLRLTVEHYCGVGTWREDRKEPATMVRYVHANGRVQAIVATVKMD